MNVEKEKRAIEYLKAFEPKDEPYYLCYSGGKDSDAIRILAQLAGVRHECKHNLTTVDAPETVRYVRETIGRENIVMPPISMWDLIVKKKLPPTNNAILLRSFQRKQRKRSVKDYGCSMGGKQFQSKKRGISKNDRQT